MLQFNYDVLNYIFNNKLRKAWKEMVLASFLIPLQHLQQTNGFHRRYNPRPSNTNKECSPLHVIILRLKLDASSHCGHPPTYLQFPTQMAMETWVMTHLRYKINEAYYF
jgi:hypothetical protein